MKFDLQDTIPAPAVEQDLIVAGKKVGFVKLDTYKDGTKYHVGLYVGSQPHYDRGYLIQGHGDTIEKAIQEALEKGRQDAENMLAGIEEMEKLLGDE